MTTAAKKITAEDLLRLPDDGFRYELVKGELRKMPPAGIEHGYLANRASWRLTQYVETHQLGKVFVAEPGFQLTANPDTVRAPDVAFISQQRLEEIGLVRGYWPGAPDLAIEVISPNDIYTEVQDKVLQWLDAGTRMVVVVNPRQQTVAVYRSRTDIAILTKNDTLDGNDVVPGWTLPIADLFVED
jgi:Uma2 family endonuclease